MGVALLLARRWKFVVASTVVSAVLASAFSLYTSLLPAGSQRNPFPDRYTPQAKVLMLPSQNAALSNAIGNASSSSGLIAGAQLGSLSSLVQSVASNESSAGVTAAFAESLLKGDALADTVTTHFDFAKRYHIRRDVKTRSRALFRKALFSEYDTKTGILTISYTSPDKFFATKVLAYTLTALDRRLSGLSTGIAIDSRDYLQQRITKAKASLDAARAKLISFEKVHGIANMQQQVQAQAAQIASLRSRIQSDETQLKSLAQYPDLKDQARITQLNVDIEVSKNLLNQLRNGTSSFNMSNIPVDQLPTVSAEYANLSLEVSLRSSTYATLRKEYETARLQANGASKSIQVIQKPQVPEVKSGPHRVALTIMIIAVVFLVAAIISIAIGRRDEERAAQDRHAGHTVA